MYITIFMYKTHFSSITEYVKFQFNCIDSKILCLVSVDLECAGFEWVRSPGFFIRYRYIDSSSQKHL